MVQPIATPLSGLSEVKQNNSGIIKKKIFEQVTIKEFAGRIFREIRVANNIDSKMINESLNPDKNIEKIKKAGESQGKSGSFFFFSHDSKFIIKTMNDGELKTFKKIFRDYE
jgi:1-phosphatidylinositol-4-phosphate 5-kinase